ncbi:MAG: glycosyltransferase family protein [candidate division Zixibacteria bacterium]|nr:glycosyltransferase family protein [candidate division Zixibacteria bacterium]
MILAILQARVSSSRLPGKVLKPILGEPMLQRQLERLANSKLIDKLVVATSEQTSDDALEELCHRLGKEFFRGDLDNVLDRFYKCAQKYHPDVIVRLTGDCPLIDPLIKEAELPSELEHVTPYIYNNEQLFRIGIFKNDVDLSHLRWTVDEKDDFDFVTLVYEELYPTKPNFTTADVLELCERMPSIKYINNCIKRNTGSKGVLNKNKGPLQGRKPSHVR